MNILKYLYTPMIESESGWLEDRHDKYKKFNSQIKEIRTRINTKGEDISPNGDYDFLEKLLYEGDNSIAGVGESKLEEADFKLFIKNEKFISSLQKFILEPNKKHFDEFSNAWFSQDKGRHLARINRVATACTDEVSTIVAEKPFKSFFKWLRAKKIIEYTGEEQDWFSQNQCLMEVMHKEFSDELKKEETDEFHLRQFLWILHRFIQPF